MRIFSFLLLSIQVLLLSLSAFSSASAAGFAISGVSVVDDLTVALDFTLSLSNDPVKVRITRTKDASSVAVASTRKDTTNDKRVLITLTDRLDPSSSYSLIVFAAKSSDGKTITDGVDSITEFATTASLVKAPVGGSNPPLNTGATMVTNNTNTQTATTPMNNTGSTNTSSTGKQNTPDVNPPHTNTGSENLPSHTDDGTKALPETGPNMILLVVLAFVGVSAFSILRKPRHS